MTYTSVTALLATLVYAYEQFAPIYISRNRFEVFIFRISPDYPSRLGELLDEYANGEEGLIDVNVASVDYLVGNMKVMSS